MGNTVNKTGKLIELEALRGLAAIVVLVHHFMLGFTPRLHGLLYPKQHISLFGTPLFAFVNGAAAVIIFFVLSGFVLTLRIFQTAKAYSGITSAVKRWPRLAATVVLANIFAGAMMATNLYVNVTAATETHSIWLGWFYNWTCSGLPEIAYAAYEGATTFFTGSTSYNPVLWTMYFEFVGSMVAIGCAIIALGIDARCRQVFFLLCFGIAFWRYPLVSPFIAGLWLASRHVRSPASWTRWQLALCIPIIVFLAGYQEDMTSGRALSWYSFLNPLVAISAVHFRILFHTIAATLLVSVFLYVDGVKQRMSCQLGRHLGFLSFPIYLVQIPIICSISARTFEYCAELNRPIQLVVTFSVTVAAVVATAVPLAYFDRWWTNSINILFASVRSKISTV
jgi:peptidoglycan/LPS O-acetylase OafA/YrhL